METSRRLIPIPLEEVAFPDLELISKWGVDNYFHQLEKGRNKSRMSTWLSNLSVVSDQEETEEEQIQKIQALDSFQDDPPNRGVKRTSTFNSQSSSGSSGYSSPPKSIKRSCTFTKNTKCNTPTSRPRPLVAEREVPSSSHFSMGHNKGSLHNLNNKKPPMIRKPVTVTTTPIVKKVVPKTPNQTRITLTSPKLGESFEKRNLEFLKRKNDKINAANKSEFKPFKARPMPNYAKMDMNKL